MPKPQPGASQASAFAVTFGAVIVLLVVCIVNAIAIIQPGTVGVVVRLGKAQDNALDEGMHFIVPFISRVQEINVKIQKAEVKTAAASKDLQMVNAAIVVNYRVDTAKAVTLYREIGLNYLPTVIEPAIHEAFKADTAKYTAEELITERSKVSQGIQESIRERLLMLGVIITAVNITDFDFSSEFNKAIEAKVTEAQRVEKAKKELERIKFEADQKIETTRGESESIMLKSKAEAEALNLKKQYATMELIWLSAVEKWDGKLPTHLFAAPPTPVFETGK
jgi:regulator of protease activity HflC (stomatin/prohibitin superfamily)